MDEERLESAIYSLFARCLQLRQKYIDVSLQDISKMASNSSRTGRGEGLLAVSTSSGLMSGSASIGSDGDETIEAAEATHVQLGPMEGVTARLGDDGVFAMEEGGSGPSGTLPEHVNTPLASVAEYYADINFVWQQVAIDGPAKSLAFRRLRYLEAEFSLYMLLNEAAEMAEQKAVPHRDFYNVRKVDTHVHHSSSMNCKHLLRFIKAKLRQCPDDVVIYRDGKHLTLREVFESLRLTAYDLSIDTLDMHAHKDAFHRFDRFNAKYNPVGESRLREIFLKTDNLIGGAYLAELTRQVIVELEASKYQMAEYRLSIYGRSEEEWTKLSGWVVDNGLFSPSVRWMVQIPRLYDTYRRTGAVRHFADYLQHIFGPLFAATISPTTHPKLHRFLCSVSGFDTVDDESKPESRRFDQAHPRIPSPAQWTAAINPPYSYYTYYLWANIARLNRLRAHRGLNTFAFRPHSGEAGDPEHLVSSFLTAQGISHGILLRKTPVLQYLYYLARIHISMSPLSNNALFLTYDRNPFLDYFQRGLLVTISTDDPLQFHFTREPLIEEYSVAAQIWKLGSGDMCEIARNSVLASGFETHIKESWLGERCYLETPDVNNIDKTNVPDRRVALRYRLLQGELARVREAERLFPVDRVASVSTTTATFAALSDAASGSNGAGRRGARRPSISEAIVQSAGNTPRGGTPPSSLHADVGLTSGTRGRALSDIILEELEQYDDDDEWVDSMHSLSATGHNGAVDEQAVGEDEDGKDMQFSANASSAALSGGPARGEEEEAAGHKKRTRYH